VLGAEPLGRPVVVGRLPALHALPQHAFRPVLQRPDEELAQGQALELDRLERLCHQLAPEQAQWTLAVIATMRVGNTEIEDRVHANPLDGGMMSPDTLAIVVALGVYITGLILYALFGAEVEAMVRSLL
jgi:hypothetical protein